MRSVLTRGKPAVLAGCLGLASGLLSCVLSQSYLFVRDQKTLDHIVWPGVVFALVVVLPISLWARHPWGRTALTLIASSIAYPIAWRIATLGIGDSWLRMIAAFACAGFFGSLVLAGVLLSGRPGGAKPAWATAFLGGAIGGLMGANLRAAMSGVYLPFTAGDGLGLFLVLWQAVVGASLGRGVQRTAGQPGEPRADAAATN